MKRKYKATEITTEVRDALALVGGVLKKRGTSVKEIQSVYEEAGFSLGDSTLYKYMDVTTAGGTPMSTSKSSGAKKKLQEEQRRIVAGFFCGEKTRV